VGGDFRQRLRGTYDVAWFDVIEEVATDTREVNRPRGSHLGHAPRSEFRNVSSSVGRTGGLRHEAARLEIVHQASGAARRKAGSAREVRHSQLAIRRFREVHDRGVLARRQANASDEIAVEEARECLENSHLGAPERLLVHGKGFDGHSYDFNLLHHATCIPWNATPPAPIPNLNN